MHRNIQNYPTVQQWVGFAKDGWHLAEETTVVFSQYVSSEYGDYFPVVAPEQAEESGYGATQYVQSIYGDYIPIQGPTSEENNYVGATHAVQSEYGDYIPVQGPTSEEAVSTTAVYSTATFGDSLPAALAQPEEVAAMGAFGVTADHS